jgi:hypothetical protein
MQVITIGKRLAPAAQITFIEAFDPAANPEFQPDKLFKDASFCSTETPF